MSLSEAAQPTRAVEQLRLPTLLALFLVPGALMTVVYVLIAPVVESAGFPPIAALLMAILVVLLPIELGVILRAGRATRSGSARSFPIAGRCPSSTGCGWCRCSSSLPSSASACQWHSSPQSSTACSDGSRTGLCARSIPDHVGDYSREAWLVTLAAYLVLNGFAGPIVEELYFRGYLLPRMEWMGRWAPLVNVSLFSLYHFWSPWQIIGRILGFGPTVYAVRWKENVYLGMVVHCTLNTLGIILVAGLVLGRV